MNDIIKNDILQLLRKAEYIIKRGELFRLRSVSNEVIHNASIFQDEDSISTAVVIYILSKLDSVKDTINILAYLNGMINSLEHNDYKSYRKKMKQLLERISRATKNTNIYISEIMQIALINKASKIYEHGISLSRVAETLGVSIWDLMDYIGKTTIPDSFGEIPDVEDKIKFTRSLFQDKK